MKSKKKRGFCSFSHFFFVLRNRPLSRVEKKSKRKPSDRTLYFFFRLDVKKKNPSTRRGTLELEMRVKVGGGGAAMNHGGSSGNVVGDNASMMAPTSTTRGEDFNVDESSPLRGIRAGRLGSSSSQAEMSPERG